MAREIKTTDEEYVRFVRRLKEEIAVRGLSQSAAAEMFETTQENLSGWLSLKVMMSGCFVIRALNRFGLKSDGS